MVTATLDAGGNWTLSGVPVSYPVALIYVYKVRLKSFDQTYSLGAYEIIPPAAGVTTDVTGFTGNLSSADTTVQKALDTLDNAIAASTVVPQVADATARNVLTKVKGKTVYQVDEARMYVCIVGA